MTSDWAVIPVKGLTDSKTRLSTYLSTERKAFVQALLQDVLHAVINSRVYDQIIVTSPDEDVGLQTRGKRVSFLKQTGYGLNRAIEYANRLALREGANSLTTILADIPLAETDDFVEIFHLGHNDRSVILAPSLKSGTNVMMGRPPGIVKPSYGRWSFTKHLRQAQLQAIPVYALANSRVSFDIDTVNDLIELKRRDAKLRTQSARVLTRVDLTPRQIRVSL